MKSESFRLLIGFLGGSAHRMACPWSRVLLEKL